MFGRLEKYPTKLDPVLKTLINKCLDRDEYRRLDAKQMIEFQNSIELEAYGEARSALILNQILENYHNLCGDPMVHQVHVGEEAKSVAELDDKYKNPHFFVNARQYPSYKSNASEAADSDKVPS